MISAFRVFSARLLRPALFAEGRGARCHCPRRRVDGSTFSSGFADAAMIPLPRIAHIRWGIWLRYLAITLFDLLYTSLAFRRLIFQSSGRPLNPRVRKLENACCPFPAAARRGRFAVVR